MNAGSLGRDTRAVSPVIGVVLVVAVTIVLAATIAPMVLDFGNNLSKSAKGAVGVTFDEGTGDGEIVVTYIDRGNTEKLDVEYSIQTAGSNGLSPPAGTKTLSEPGDSFTIEEDASNTDEDVEVKVVVTAYLESGERSVIYSGTGTI